MEGQNKGTKWRDKMKGQKSHFGRIEKYVYYTFKLFLNPSKGKVWCPKLVKHKNMGCRPLNKVALASYILWESQNLGLCVTDLVPPFSPSFQSLHFRIGIGIGIGIAEPAFAAKSFDK